MGKRDDVPRTTREFDSAKLAALTKQALANEPSSSKVHVEPVQEEDASEPVPTVGRTATLDDPLTTGLLAEVARRSQTSDFDEDLIKEVLTKLDGGETSHPHTRRRTK